MGGCATDSRSLLWVDQAPDSIGQPHSYAFNNPTV